MKATGYPGMISNLTSARLKSQNFLHCVAGTDRSLPGHQRNLITLSKDIQQTMDLYRNFSKSGRRKQLWKNWEQMYQHTSCHTPDTQRNHSLFNTMHNLKVSPVTFIPMVSTKICIYEGNSWTLPQNFLQLLPFHTTCHQTFHNQPFWWFRIMLISCWVPTTKS